MSHWARWVARLHFGELKRVRPRRAESLGIHDWEPLQRLIGAYALVGTKVPVSTSQWITIAGFVQDFRVMSQTEGARLAQIYKSSKRRLLPLSDPLDVEFHLHRQLFSSREEVYSDWLQWVLQHVADSDPLLIGRILGSPNRELFAHTQEPISVTREVSVEHGRDDQSGRLDLVVSRGATTLAVIEVKTRDYGNSDLEKHKGYRDSITVRSPEAELIFLSVDPPASDPGGFRLLSWADLCVALRGTAPRLLTPGRILGTALILAFVGAVEQNLLGFVSPEAALMPVGKIPKLVDHLTRAERMEAALGQP
jgi:hypothetical protein